MDSSGFGWILIIFEGFGQCLLSLIGFDWILWIWDEFLDFGGLSDLNGFWMNLFRFSKSFAHF